MNWNLKSITAVCFWSDESLSDLFDQMHDYLQDLEKNGTNYVVVGTNFNYFFTSGETSYECVLTIES